MKRLILIALMALPMAALAAKTTAFKTGERTTGMTKQCYYQALGNEYTITIRATELCPLTIQVDI